ncbi:hypothetical protein ACJMK2_015592 [Sinanodonta woodiana]|uniref:Uncharacterized protein n=1 Tax=Sinanodonta woodiana TaxID=1069815 RepID=A0ABD3US46_SINWO
MAEAVQERPKRKTKLKKPKERESQVVIQDRDKRSSDKEFHPITPISEISKPPDVETSSIFPEPESQLHDTQTTSDQSKSETSTIFSEQESQLHDFQTASNRSKSETSTILPEQESLLHDVQTTSNQSKSRLHDPQSVIHETGASGMPAAELENTGFQSKSLLHNANSDSLNQTYVVEPVIPTDSSFVQKDNRVESKVTTGTDETKSDSKEKEKIKAEKSTTCEGQSKSETKIDVTPEVTNENKLEQIDSEKRTNEDTMNLISSIIDASARDISDEHGSCERVKTFGPVLYADLREEKAKMMLEIQMEQRNRERILSEQNLAQCATISDEKIQHLTSQECLPEAQSTVRSKTAPSEELLIQHEQKTRNKTTIIQNQEKVYNPLTIEQLSSLYYNPELSRNKQFIDNFVLNEQKKEGHEFYEILMNYQRSRKNLIQSEEGVKTLEKKYMQTESEVWLTRTCAVAAKGKCGDAAKCQGTHKFEKCEINYVAFTELKKTLETMQEHLEKQLSLHLYSAQLSRLQVESYIHNLFMTSPALRDIPRNAPVQVLDGHSADTSHQVRKLRDCISVIFAFHRRPADDEEFVSNLQSWTERLVSALLRIATSEDHLFILNHILRCPGGIGQWTGHFVQVPPIPSAAIQTPPIFGSPILDHLVTCLATILIRTAGREEFLCHLRKVFTPDTKDEKSITWIMVNFDGEEVSLFSFPD